MEEERLIALAKVKEREMLEKLEKLMKQRDIGTITEDSEEEANGSETKEDEEPEPLLYFTRKRLVELGHWNNDPLLKRVSSSCRPADPTDPDACFTFGVLFVRASRTCMHLDSPLPRLTACDRRRPKNRILHIQVLPSTMDQ